MHVPAVDTSSNSQSLSKQQKMLIDALSGAVSGCIARVVVGPLDVIKIRFQVQLEPLNSSAKSKYTGFGQALVAIFREEGMRGLWRGTIPGLLLQVPYTAVQFVAYQHCLDTASRLGLTGPDRSTSPFVSFGSGAVAGVCGTVASYPFDLLRTTLAAQGEPRVYSNMFDAARGIIKAGGIGGLYRGLGVTVVEIIPGAALQFGLYDLFKSTWKKIKQGQKSGEGSKEGESSTWLDGWANFSCGFLAGLMAKLATHPLDVAKKRYQVAGLQRSLAYGARVDTSFALNSLATSLVCIYKAEGLSGLWKGSLPNLIKAAPNSAVSFMVYDLIREALLKVASPHPELLSPLESMPLTNRTNHNVMNKHDFEKSQKRV